jgi:transmembrane sensor
VSSDRPSVFGVAGSSREHASAAAVEWLLRHREGRLSRAERVEFVRWLRESPLNSAEYLRIANIAGTLSAFRRWSELPQARGDAQGAADADEKVRWLPGARIGQQVHARELSSPSTWRRVGAPIAALAATFAIVVCGVLWWLGVIGGVVYTTGPGELRSVTLVDGSELSLASGTRLRVKFDDDLRKIVLTRGEALFQVTRDPARPFVVHAGRTQARAVGTAFSVQRNAQQVVVTVGEGAVAVSQVESMLRPFSRAPVQADVSLTADQQIAASPDGRLDPVRSVDSQRALAWAKGELIFENETIEAIAARFNQFSRVKLRVEDQRIRTRTVSGIFDVRDPESFVAFLASVEPVTVTRQGSGVIVIGAAGSAGPVVGTTR